jgi:hypothetical protein
VWEGFLDKDIGQKPSLPVCGQTTPKGSVRPIFHFQSSIFNLKSPHLTITFWAFTTPLA